MVNPMLEQFKAARRTGTPLIAIQTPDPAATIQAIKAATPEESPVIQWDICRGWLPVNEAGDEVIQITCKDSDPKDVTANPTEMLMLAAELPAKTILFALNAQRYLTNDPSPASAGFAQALWNLRDLFKRDLRTVVLLGPSFTFPPELSQDVLLLDEPLPSEAELRGVVVEVMRAAEMEDEIDEDTSARAVDALRGLAAFAAEQVTAMSVSRDGLNVEGLWERKRRMIEQTEGLSVWREGQRFDDLGGLAQAKEFFRRVINSREAPRVIVFVDEIEKAMAGATSSTSDSSGVSQGFLGTLLSYLQDTRATGAIFVGPAGSGKSILAKTIGNEAGVPTITLDLAGMKQSLVGQSEANLRQALKVITAVGGGRSLWIATSNDISALKPELKARFRLGTWFFDIPDDREREAIWKLYLKAREIDPAELSSVDAAGWVGREIENCAYLAWNLRMTLADAARFIVPVIKSDPQGVERLRREASGRYLSASYSGTYQGTSQALAATATPSRRQIKLED
jgi:hypothetical protein